MPALVEIAAVVERWRRDPAAFVREALQAAPSGQQEAALRAFAHPGARVAIKSGHGTGKSTLMSWLILWALCCFTDVKCPVTAPTAHQLQDVLWTEVRKWGERLPSLWRNELEVTADIIRFKSCPSFAVARTGRKENPEALQGFHAGNLMFFVDEASGIDDVVFQVAQGALSTPGSRIIMAANPTRTSGYFYNAFHRDRDRWTRFTFSCLESPHVAPEYARGIAESYGEGSDIYKVRVLGEFPGTSDLQFIPTSLVDAVAGKHLSKDQYGFAPVILGADVARFGDDRSTIAIRQGLYGNILWRGRGVDTMTFADTVATLWRGHAADAVMIDGNGVGAGVVDRLRQMGFAPIDVQAGGASALRNCLNKRAEMWWRLRDWLRDGGAIPDDEDLRADLTAPEYQYTVKGLVQLEKKDDMKKRGLPSPDLADALALTFAVPVNAGNAGAFERRTADDDYDLFAL
ncbi:hypothetical protein [Pyramidobacter piscolens]|uniref:hypothetical protein n=1 Tax=Pyramidobacter piscolens TaxID=638849 RepID=UPI0026665316|nr:hypothetical protein [Pyramidobacter piscolens]